MRRRTLLTLLALLVLAALAAAHVAYWYWPRLRTGRPGDGRAAALLASDAYPAAVWVPYPHQNLAVLERSTEAPTELVDAVARLASLPRPTWPSFGPLRMPPSREIAFASDGERFALVAEVYPMVATFAKLAGRLADNPWLTGGELSLEGRHVEVAWHGSTWTIASPSLPDLADAAPHSPGEPFSLLDLRVRQTLYPLPAGHYRLTAEDGDIVVRSEETIPRHLEFEGRLLTEATGELRLFLLAISGQSVTVDEPVQALALYAPTAPVALEGEQGHVYELPGMAVLYQTGGERWSMPGEGLLELAGREVRDEEFGAWSLAALDDASFAAAREILPQFAPLTEARPGGRLVWGLWLDLETGAGEVSRIARALEEIPFVSERRRERWRDTEIVLRGVSRTASRLTIVVTEEPRAFRLRLEGQ